MNIMSQKVFLRWCKQFLCALLLLACEKEDLKPTATIQFASGQQSVLEGGEATIELTLNHPLDKSALVRIRTSGINYDQSFQEANSEGLFDVVVEKGETSIPFKITTIDNDVFDGTKYIIFTLFEPSSNLQIAGTTTTTLSILDDEGPSVANFEVALKSMNESDVAGVSIRIPFSAPAEGKGIVNISIEKNSAVYGVDFSTDPVSDNNIISFEVSPGDTELSFTVTPLNNEVYTGNRQIAFSIATVAGVVRKGTNLSCILTIVDDESPSVAEFATNGSVLLEANADGNVVLIKFSSPAAGAGTMTVGITPGSAIYGTNFTTFPAAIQNQFTLEVPAGSIEATFKVLPINNSVYSNDLDILFTITSTTGVVKSGIKIKHNVSLVDDENEPALIGFANTAGLVDEEDPYGLLIELPLSKPAGGVGTVELLLPPGYATEYVTEPAPIAGKLSLKVVQNDTKTSFKLRPIRNPQCHDRVLYFSIKFSYGSIATGNAANFVAKIVDTDAQNIAFEKTSVAVAENSTEWITVKVLFSKPVVFSGQIYVTTYEGAPFVSEPASYFDYDYYSYYYLTTIRVDFVAGSTGTEFRLKPIDNFIKNPAVNIVFKLDGKDVCLRSTNEFTLTVNDND